MIKSMFKGFYQLFIIMQEKKMFAAGIIPIDKQTGDILLLKRSFKVSNPNFYAPPGGKIDLTDKSAKDAAIREFREETGYQGNFDVSKEVFYINDSNFLTFYTFVGLLPSKFEVKIDESETSDFCWVPLDGFPKNLLPGFAELMTNKRKELEEIIDKY